MRRAARRRFDSRALWRGAAEAAGQSLARNWSDLRTAPEKPHRILHLFGVETSFNHTKEWVARRRGEKYERYD